MKVAQQNFYSAFRGWCHKFFIDSLFSGKLTLMQLPRNFREQKWRNVKVKFSLFFFDYSSVTTKAFFCHWKVAVAKLAQICSQTTQFSSYDTFLLMFFMYWLKGVVSSWFFCSGRKLIEKCWNPDYFQCWFHHGSEIHPFWSNCFFNISEIPMMYVFLGCSECFPSMIKSVFITPRLHEQPKSVRFLLSVQKR